MSNQAVAGCDLDETYCRDKHLEQITFSAALSKQLITRSKKEES